MLTLLSSRTFLRLWVIGGAALWLMLRSVGAHPEAASVVFLGGVSAVGAIVSVADRWKRTSVAAEGWS